ncbi:hypothetical protein T484DRAFT_1794240 [Baffinella frigidus]|nr:hypothetical protein T484DRAFT_1794240 [Cryptophyta sp. CCMP2293]
MEQSCASEAALSTRVANLDALLSQVTEELAAKKTECTTAVTDCCSLRTKHSALETKLSALEATQASADTHVRTATDSASKEIASLKEKLAKVEQEGRSQNENQTAKHSASVAALTARIATDADKIKGLEAELAEIEASRTATEALGQQLDASLTENQELRSSLDTAKVFARVQAILLAAARKEKVAEVVKEEEAHTSTRLRWEGLHDEALGIASALQEKVQDITKEMEYFRGEKTRLENVAAFSEMEALENTSEEKIAGLQRDLQQARACLVAQAKSNNVERELLKSSFAKERYCLREINVRDVSEVSSALAALRVAEASNDNLRQKLRVAHGKTGPTQRLADLNVVARSNMVARSNSGAAPRDVRTRVSGELASSSTPQPASSSAEWRAYGPAASRAAGGARGGSPTATDRAALGIIEGTPARAAIEGMPARFTARGTPVRPTAVAGAQDAQTPRAKTPRPVPGKHQGTSSAAKRQEEIKAMGSVSKGARGSHTVKAKNERPRSVLKTKTLGKLPSKRVRKLEFEEIDHRQATRTLSHTSASDERAGEGGGGRALRNTSPHAASPPGSTRVEGETRCDVDCSTSMLGEQSMVVATVVPRAVPQDAASADFLALAVVLDENSFPPPSTPRREQGRDSASPHPGFGWRRNPAFSAPPKAPKARTFKTALFSTLADFGCASPRAANHEQVKRNIFRFEDTCSSSLVPKSILSAKDSPSRIPLARLRIQ